MSNDIISISEAAPMTNGFPSRRERWYSVCLQITNGQHVVLHPVSRPYLTLKEALWVLENEYNNNHFRNGEWIVGEFEYTRLHRRVWVKEEKCRSETYSASSQ